jgi:hypothetical protein
VADPGAVDDDAATVQIDEALGRRQPGAVAAVGPAQGVRRLREHLEHAREHLRLDADAPVPD